MVEKEKEKTLPEKGNVLQVILQGNFKYKDGVLKISRGSNIKIIEVKEINQ